MQYLYDQFGLATSDDYELGMRYDYSRFHIAPSVFYDKYRNKLLTIWDPIAQRTIRQAIGNSRVKGAELEAGASLFRQLNVFMSFSYNNSALLDNLYTASSAFVAVKGKQTVDTPPYVLKGRLTYTVLGASISPVERYVSTKYGDTGNTQKVPSYAVTDVTLSYGFKQIGPLCGVKAVKGLSLSVSCLNFFNRRYIAVIGAFEDAQSASYLVGAPRTVVGKIGANLQDASRSERHFDCCGGNERGIAVADCNRYGWP